MTGRPLHLRGPAGRHRHRVSRAPGRPRSPSTSTRSRRRSTTPTGTRSSRASTTPATSPRCAALVAEHGVQPDRAARPTSTTACSPRARDELGALVLLPRPETIELCEDKYAGAPLLRASTGSPRRRPGCRSALPDELAFPGARQGAARASARATSTARTTGAELEFFLALHDAPTRWCRRSAAARSSRSTSSATSTGAA